MKRTFFIAMPRSGTYALSKILSTDTCIAHHETDTDNIVAGAQWNTTNAYKSMRQAHEEGKNYACCNQAFGLQLFTMYLEDFSRRLTEAMTIQEKDALWREIDNVTVVYLFVDPLFSVESFSKLCPIPMSKAKRHAMFSQMFQFSKAVAATTDVLNYYGIEGLMIDKEKDGVKLNGHIFFSSGQLTELCLLTGAGIDRKEELQYMPMSRTWAELSRAGARINAALKQKGMRMLHSMIDLLEEAEDVIAEDQAKGKN